MAKFQNYKGHEYRIKNGYLYGKGWHFGLNLDAILREYGSIEAYWDNEEKRLQNTPCYIV